MASGKKRRKAAKLTKAQQQPRTGPFRHKDGDRRHRGGITYREVMAQKRLEQLLGAPILPADEEE